MILFAKKTFCHPERSEGSIIRHASSLFKSANRSFVLHDDKPFKTSISWGLLRASQ
jgi:hypothetical protein